MSIVSAAYFHDEAAAHAKLERLRWPRGAVCPHCGACDQAGRVKGCGARIALRFCRRCRKQFRATIGTVFEYSHVPLHGWFRACLLRTGCEYATNASQLCAVAGVSHKTARCMVDRIDRAFALMGGTIAAGRRFPRGSAAWAFAGIEEEEVPWVTGPAAAGGRSAAFVTSAMWLRPIADEARFDAVVAGLVRGPGYGRREAAPAEASPAL